MKIPDYAIKITLVVLFLAAAGARFSSTASSRYPYFPGQSAMNYRDALRVSVERGGTVLDRHTDKSNWPQGYRPARVRPVGVEYFAGYVLRVAKWLSDEDTRAMARRLVVLFFSLCVFTLYALGRRLWESQAAGLMAAAMVALFPPLVEATNGADIGHTTFALVLITLHILSLLWVERNAAGSWSRAPWIAGVAGMALTTLVLVTWWELAGYYVAICSVTATLLYPLPARERRVLAVAHLAAFAAADAVSTYAAASRLAFSWQAALLVACCAQTFMPPRFQGVKRGAAFVAGATVVLTLLAAPLRAGDSVTGLPGVEYLWYRIRYAFARPLSPSLLPARIRELWSSDHAQPSAHQLIAFLLPFALFLAVAAAEAGRYLKRHDARDGRGAGDARARVIAAAAVAVAGIAAYALDRGAVALAVVAVLPFAALAGRALEGPSKARAAATVAGALIVAGSILWPQGRADAALQISRALGVAHRDEAKVLWVSVANTDAELIRFVASRTSTTDPILGMPRATALLLTFCGRTSVLLEGGYSDALAQKRFDMIRAIYGEEDDLYLRCREARISYVLYSIDFVLDTTRYSPLYLSGLTTVPERSVALSMQFAPEELTHFNLAYENDRYRLFRVTDAPEPVFLTDHPPVYQKDIMVRHGDDYRSFRERIARVLVVYSEAKGLAASGRFDAAVARLSWCLQEAPRFTLARIALGSALLEAGQTDRAKDVLMSVIQYAPDNAEALYLAADALSKLGEDERALDLLKILYGATRDTELLDRARLLESLIVENASAAPDSTVDASPR
jgi:tetratricopeptide (TPR) repeat protein